MIFKELVYDNGKFVYKTADVSNFLSKENKSLGYVLRKTQIKHHHWIVTMVFAFESNNAEGDDEYTLITPELAANILRFKLFEIKRTEKAAVENFYDEMILSLSEI
mgnify:FL=1